MADYGHDLVFGTFLTPQNAEPQAPVALAQLSERAGLDLVTFQDHPYQPAFLDTWTLMSYVAASTERIRISGNVLNLPLRPPVLLARQAATLDLLSGGRFELGLGPAPSGTRSRRWAGRDARRPGRSPACARRSTSSAPPGTPAGGAASSPTASSTASAAPSAAPSPPMTCPSGSACSGRGCCA